MHLVAKFQANRSNGSVCAGPSVLSGLPVRAGAGALTEILLSVNTPVPQQRGIWADLQNLTKCYAIRKPEVGEARNSQETLPTLSAACVEHQTGADIVGLAVPHVHLGNVTKCVLHMFYRLVKVFNCFEEKKWVLCISNHNRVPKITFNLFVCLVPFEFHLEYSPI